MAKKGKGQANPIERAPKDIWSLPDGHHVGDTTGFTKKGDAIYLAPTHVEPRLAIRLDREALQDFINAMNQHVHAQMQKIARREHEWWKFVENDLGIKGDDAVYFYNEECIRRKVVEKEEPPR